MKYESGFFLILALLSWQASANESMQNVDVVQLGTYQAHTDHFVWLSDTPAECKATSGNHVLHFQDDQPGGKALLAVLMTALVNKRKIDVQTNGCDIVEVYLK
ncbi:hypothetical protein [uncultured Xanthomonas sp.]|uniref:hypothetical protein n=1 Tax=uncultured Xanthomonas sp. TaxID=152831 RepID=UPI0025F90141|nr:hypothetical protein [uncultured Xanthomonas sp.]